MATLPATPEAVDGEAPPPLDLEAAALPPAKHQKKGWRATFALWIKREVTIIWDMLCSSYLNVLLVLVPVALGLGFAHSEPVAVFVLNFVALVPLALLLGDVTEHLAERFGDVIGGLLNATFGNIVEIVLAIQALRKDLVMLVEMSLVGSVLSNLLMVLGFIFACGGYYHHFQTFSVDSMQAQFALIFLAVIGLCLPTAAPFFNKGMTQHVGAIGHASAVLLLSTYLLYLVFQLYTHPEVGAGEDEDDDDASQAAEGSATLRAEQADRPTELPSAAANGQPSPANMLPSVASGRELSRVDQLPVHHAHIKGPGNAYTGRTGSGRPSGGDLEKGAVTGIAGADSLRSRTRSGPIEAARQGSAPPTLCHSGSAVRPYAGAEAAGKPIEVVNTPSGRLVEMIRTDSGHLVELLQPLDRASKGGPLERSSKGGPLDRPSRRGSRTLSGRTHSGYKHVPLDRTTSGRYQVRTESGRQMTDLELVEVNRARRIMGRPALKAVAVVTNPTPAPSNTHPAGGSDGDRSNDGMLLTNLAAVSVADKSAAPVEEKSIDDAILSVPMAILMLAGLAALIAIHCEWLTDAIQEFGEITGLSQPFIGLILVPIAGNVCEHLASVVMACKGRMNLALGIAIGSATQIALLCIPLLVIIAWGMDKPFNMDIDIYPLFCLIMAVVLAYQLTAAGKSTWLSGIGPCVVYLIIAVAYYFNDEQVDLGRK